MPAPTRARLDQTKTRGLLRNLARRLVVSLTQAKGIWQLLGYEDDDGHKETFAGVEAMPWVGFYARPRDGAQTDAIVIKVGGESGHPVVIACRDLGAQVEIDKDETAVFNSTGAVVKITKDGDIIIRAKAGRTVSIDDGSGAVALATKADVQTIRDQLHEHTHLPGSFSNGGGAVTGVSGTGPALSSPTGTTVARGK